ncbi:glycoside hydrolase family 105 protein [Massilia sp. TS11]|uniref:glycoside hydrolase family 88/105 protein n=1 Tax=Massilia sp. TS11 TaxID=2908003 RepID=UPI001EDAB52B|nr:glycoside hydrolase family 88 protein [Massilia sp. TS11]MCG2583932.1 glycoside hydrolase family 88 protein [Massilia sp. TS11]
MNSIRTAVLALCLGLAASAQAAPQPTPAMQAIIDKDTSRHFGDAPQNPGPRASDLSAALEPAAVDKVLRKVADWQLARHQPHFDQLWTAAVMYSGFMAASEATGDSKYRDAMREMGKKFDWKLRGTYPNADDIAIAQTYLELYFIDKKPEYIANARSHLDTLLPLQTLRPGDERQPWWWCDALFMAPPVWAKMAAATGERKYLDYLHREWQRTYDALYDPAERLYARDVAYLSKREFNGKKVFWSRGEGWVLGGLARTLDVLPADDPKRGFYVKQLQDMAARVAELQDKDGAWHAGMLDPETWPAAETSGASLFVFGMAYGINHGLLDAKTYRPVIDKAWKNLVANIYADGRLGNIQQTGAEPAWYQPSSSYNYGVGGFMLAAAELKRMVSRP